MEMRKYYFFLQCWISNKGRRERHFEIIQDLEIEKWYVSYGQLLTPKHNWLLLDQGTNANANGKIDNMFFQSI